MTNSAETKSAGSPWLSISDLAAYRGVGKPATSERVKALEAEGKVRTRKGPNRTKLVCLAEFLAAVGEAGDPGRELAAESRSGGAESDAPASPGYRDAQTRKASAEAALREYDLAVKQGELVAISELTAAGERTAEALAAVIERLPQRAAEMAAAVGRDGERGARAQYRRDARQLREAMVAAIDRLLAGFATLNAPSVAPALEPAPLWGDLDPAARD